MNAVPQLREPREKINQLKSVLQNPKVVGGIKAVIPAFVTPERMLRIVTNAVEKNPLLAECSQSSFLGCVMASAALGLEPNTLAGHAYLIPYQTRRKINGQWTDVYECQFQMGYKGYIELAYRNENCVSFVGLPVFSGDRFRHYIGGDLGELTVEYEAARKDRGDLEGAFSQAVYQRASGARGKASVWMPEDEIEKVRQKSQTYTSLLAAVERAESDRDRQRAEKNLAETPWVAWGPDMYAKSAIRKLAKQLPIFGNMLGAANLEDRSDSGAINMEAMSDPSVAKAVASGEEEPPTIEHDAEPDRPALTAPGPQDKVVDIQAQGGREKQPAERKRGGGEKATQAAAQRETSAQTPHDPDTGEVLDEGQTGDGDGGYDDRGGDEDDNQGGLNFG